MDYAKTFSELHQRAEQLRFFDETERKSIAADVELYGERVFGNDKYTQKLNDIGFHPCFSPCSDEAEAHIWSDGKSELLILLKTMIKDYSLISEEEKRQKTRKAKSETIRKSKSKIFIVHGHDEKLKFEVAEWLHSLDIEPIILHLQPNAGLNSVLAKIESNSDVAAAIVLFTADDLGQTKTEDDLHVRARQNVVFEAGYFVGKLGAGHVILLHEPMVELPSDLSGILYIPTNSQWKEDIRKELNAMGLEYKRI